MELYRAIILEKKILFLAHNISSSELCTVSFKHFFLKKNYFNIIIIIIIIIIF